LEYLEKQGIHINDDCKPPEDEIYLLDKRNVWKGTYKMRCQACKLDLTGSVYGGFGAIIQLVRN
jgi:hypothetical protein